VFVHLFEWKWPDIAAECESVLGPAGFTAVQVSPPQEHSMEASHTWSQRYQPVSYRIDRSRSGTRAEFLDMVTRCAAAGVGIYVDAVINHMTNFPSPGVGSNGTAYTKYNYPGLYAESDFHPACVVNDYQSAANVQDCELFSLPDLNTGLASVRQKLADYLLMLARLGVAGFRVDALHYPAGRADSIIGRVNRTPAAEGSRPYFFLRWWWWRSAVTARLLPARVTARGRGGHQAEFTFTGVQDKFRQAGGYNIPQLDPNGRRAVSLRPAWNMMPGDKAVVFLQNHDTQHQAASAIGTAMFSHGQRLMLAQPYGYPSALSSYAFSDNVMGPPDASGNTNNVACAARTEAATVGQWVCEHRDAAIARMVRFRKVVAGTEVANWWDNGANAIAFSRGTKGFVAINRESHMVTARVTTSLPPGTYCDRLTGGRLPGTGTCRHEHRGGRGWQRGPEPGCQHRDRDRRGDADPATIVQRNNSVTASTSTRLARSRVAPRPFAARAAAARARADAARRPGRPGPAQDPASSSTAPGTPAAAWRSVRDASRQAEWCAPSTLNRRGRPRSSSCHRPRRA
jgi:alpha-amylase